MTRLLLTQLLLTFSLATLATGACAGLEQDPEQHNADRRPLGKADNTGSCVDTDCDGPSDGSCFCDDRCIEFGDCCSDRASVCEAPVSQICGGFAGFQCGEGEYCNFEEDAFCGFADASGVCRPMALACTKEFLPVCGCNGETFGNSCMANAAGTSVKSEGPCDTEPAGCEPVTCELYCENGFDVDLDGCEICSCASGSSHD